MRIGIIGAMQIEIEDLKPRLNNTYTETYSGIEFLSGQLYGNEVVAAVSGVGKVFAAMCAQTMILKYNVDMIINIGVAGTLDRDLGIMDIAIATDLVQHDMDTYAYSGEAPGLIMGLDIVHIPTDGNMRQIMMMCADESGRRYKLGTIATGDQFIHTPWKKQQLREDFGAIACEMEGGAIAHVCYANKVPCLVLRTISDGEGAAVDFGKFAEDAALVAINLVSEFVKKAR